MKILLIISGSIAAVKAYDLVRTLVKNGHFVSVVLTKSAQEFVTKEAMTILTSNKVYSDLFDIELESQIGHIALSRDSDIILIAPATSHIIGKIAHGLSDDLATTLIAAANKPIFIAPAMNPFMWENNFFQKNLQLLSEKNNYYIIPPNQGIMACGEYGIGRMAEIEEIIDAIMPPQILKGKHVLVTLGATIEKIDPIRFLSNFSSGKQGLSIAIEAYKRGANVTMVAGSMTIKVPDYIKSKLNIINVMSAQEMFAATIESLPADIAICTAAVSDWRPIYHMQKMKKTSDNTLTLKLEKNPDILHTICHSQNRPNYVIGFAAETDNILENAIKKREQKNCDVLYVNEITSCNNVFGSDYNSVTEIKAKSQEKLDHCSKNMLAKLIIDRIPESILI